MVDILAAFPGAKRSRAGWSARCPAHDDQRQSLSIGQGDAGKWLLRCHAGCNLTKILAAAHLDVQDLFPDADTRQRPEIVEVYDYSNEQGILLYQAVRRDPATFKLRRPDGQGGWHWNLNGVRRVLYRLQTLPGKKTVFIVEGEKDANRLVETGLTATTNDSGVGMWRDEYTQQLIAAGIQEAIVIPDNDDVGITHARDVAARCHAAGITTKLVTLPGVAPRGDVTDYLTEHRTGNLLALVEATPLFAPEAADLVDCTINNLY